MGNGPEGRNEHQGEQGRDSDEVAHWCAPDCPACAVADLPNDARTRYFDLYDRAPVGYCTLDVNGLILQGNRRASALLGPSREALVGQPMSGFIAPEHAGVFEQFRQRLVESGEPQSCEVRLRPVAPEDSGGVPSWVQLFAAAASASEYRLVLTDVSQRRAAEEELREQKEFFHLIAENIGDFIAVLDLEGRRLYNSPSYLNFFGAQRDLLGTNSFAEVHPDDRELVRNTFLETVKTGAGPRSRIPHGDRRRQRPCHGLARQRDPRSRGAGGARRRRFPGHYGGEAPR